MTLREALGCMVLGAFGVACGSGDDEGKQPFGTTKPLPQLESAALTTEVTLELLHPVSTTFELDPRDVAHMNQMLAEGYGETTLGPGRPVTSFTLDDSTPPAPGAGAKLITRFVHLADTQLADDESPARVVRFDTAGPTSGAFRPQEGHQCRILNAAVRTINAVHRSTPLDFVVLGGDNADNAQENELDWFLGVLGGDPQVECDSGADDDPVRGANNDPKDPFIPEGLLPPWYWVTGNHDVLVQGNFPIYGREQDALGDWAANGTRDWSKPGGPMTLEDVIPDPKRALMDHGLMLDRLAAAGVLGIDSATIAYGKAYYTFDIPGTPVRFIVMDTAAPTGSADGVILTEDVVDFLLPALDAAKAANKWVVLTSHHGTRNITDGGGFGGAAQATAITVDEWTDLVGAYDNVLMHLAGHTHVHRTTRIEPAGATATPYWELETSALADYPHQVRLIEITDQDNGFVSIRAIAVDFATDDDPIAADGRRRGITDFTSGWSKDGAGDLGHVNVELWVKKPN
ncbi:MAG: metallophosphoesterase [Polyangiaceae bacterium]|nr:metallophosphoesterase [Polyangiaceae bacterium]